MLPPHRGKLERPTRDRRSSLPTMSTPSISIAPKRSEETKAIPTKPKRGGLRKSLGDASALLHIPVEQSKSPQKHRPSKRKVSFGVVGLRLYDKDNGNHLDMGSVHKFDTRMSDGSPASVGIENIPPSDLQTKIDNNILPSKTTTTTATTSSSSLALTSSSSPSSSCSSNRALSLRDLLTDSPDKTPSEEQEDASMLTGDFMTADFKRASESLVAKEGSSFSPTLVAQLSSPACGLPRIPESPLPFSSFALSNADVSPSFAPNTTNMTMEFTRCHSKQEQNSNFLSSSPPALSISASSVAGSPDSMMQFLSNNASSPSSFVERDEHDRTIDVTAIQLLSQINPPGKETVFRSPTMDLKAFFAASDEADEEGDFKKFKNSSDSSPFAHCANSGKSIEHAALSPVSYEQKAAPLPFAVFQDQFMSPEPFRQLGVSNMEMTENHDLPRQQPVSVFEDVTNNQPSAASPSENMDFTSNHSTIQQLGVLSAVAESPISVHLSAAIDSPGTTMEFTHNYSSIRAEPTHIRRPLQNQAFDLSSKDVKIAFPRNHSSIRQQLAEQDMEFTRNHSVIGSAATSVHSSLIIASPEQEMKFASSAVLSPVEDVDMDFTKNHSLISNRVVSASPEGDMEFTRNHSTIRQQAASSPEAKDKFVPATDSFDNNMGHTNSIPHQLSAANDEEEDMLTIDWSTIRQPLADSPDMEFTRNHSIIRHQQNVMSPGEDMQLTKNLSSIRQQAYLDSPSNRTMDFTTNHSSIRQQMPHLPVPETGQKSDAIFGLSPASSLDGDMEFTKNHSVIRQAMLSPIEDEDENEMGEAKHVPVVTSAQTAPQQLSSQQQSPGGDIDFPRSSSSLLTSPSEEMEFTRNHSTIRQHPVASPELDMQFTENHSVIRKQTGAALEGSMELLSKKKILDNANAVSTQNYSSLSQQSVANANEPEEDMLFTTNHSSILQSAPSQSIASPGMELTTNHSVIRQQILGSPDEAVIDLTRNHQQVARSDVGHKMHKGSVASLPSVSPLDEEMDFTKNHSVIWQQSSASQLSVEDMEFTKNYSSIRARLDADCEQDMEFTKNHSVIRARLAAESPEQDMEFTRNHSSIRARFDAESPEQDMEFTKNYSTIYSQNGEASEEDMEFTRNHSAIRQQELPLGQSKDIQAGVSEQPAVDDEGDMEFTKNHSSIRCLQPASPEESMEFTINHSSIQQQQPTQADEEAPIDSPEVEFTGNNSSLIAQLKQKPLEIKERKHDTIAKENNAASSTLVPATPKTAARSVVQSPMTGDRGSLLKLRTQRQLSAEKLRLGQINSPPHNSFLQEAANAEIEERSRSISDYDPNVNESDVSMDFTKNYSSIRKRADLADEERPAKTRLSPARDEQKFPTSLSSDVDVDLAQDCSAGANREGSSGDYVNEGLFEMTMEFTDTQSKVYPQVSRSLEKEVGEDAEESKNNNETNFASLFCNEDKGSASPVSATIALSKQFYADVLLGVDQGEKTADLPGNETWSQKTANQAGIWRKIFDGSEPTTADYSRSSPNSSDFSQLDQSMPEIVVVSSKPDKMSEDESKSLSHLMSPTSPLRSPIKFTPSTAQSTGMSALSPLSSPEPLSKSVTSGPSQLRKSRRRSLGTTPDVSQYQTPATISKKHRRRSLDSTGSTFDHSPLSGSVCSENGDDDEKTKGGLMTSYFRTVGLDIDKVAVDRQAKLTQSAHKSGKSWPPVNIEDMLECALIEVTEINWLAQICQDVVSNSSDMKDIIMKHMRELDENPPPILCDFSLKSGAEQVEAAKKLDRITQECQAEAKAAFYDWQGDEYLHLADLLEKGRVSCSKDISKMDKLLDRVDALLDAMKLMRDSGLKAMWQRADENAENIRNLESRIAESKCLYQQHEDLVKLLAEAKVREANRRMAVSETKKLQKTHSAANACTGCKLVSANRCSQYSEMTMSFGTRNMFYASLRYDASSKLIQSPTITMDNVKPNVRLFFSKLLETGRPDLSTLVGKHQTEASGVLVEQFRRLDILDRELLAIDARFTVMRRIEKGLPKVIVYIFSLDPRKQDVQVELELTLSLNYPFDFLPAAVRINQLGSPSSIYSTLQTDIVNKLVPETTGFGRITRIVDRVAARL